MEEIICPACGDNDLGKKILIKQINEPYGGIKHVETISYTCNLCGFSGDILKENEKSLQLAIDELKAQAVKNILGMFQKNHYNFSAIERALEIPQRSLSKWKSSSKPSAAVVALLKYLHLFPWLIEVAEQKYDFKKAQQIHMTDALSQFVSQMTFNEETRWAETTTTFEVLRMRITQTFESESQEDPDDGFGFSLVSRNDECLALE